MLAKLLSLTGRELDAVKVGALETRVAAKLRDFGHKFAAKLDAKPIENPPGGEFSRHGFCAGGLTTDADNRWINTVRDSWRTQGTFVRDGTMHPNLRGQGAIGRELLGWLVENECRDHTSKESRVDDPEQWHTLCDAQDWQRDSLLVQPANVDP